MWKGGVLVMAITGLAFPLAGMAMLAALLFETVCARWMPSLRAKLN